MKSIPDALKYIKCFKLFCIFPTEFNSKVLKYQPMSLKGYYFLALMVLTAVHIVPVMLIANQFTKGMSNVTRKFSRLHENFLVNTSQKIRLCLKECQQMMSLSIIITCFFKRNSLTDTMNLYMEIDQSLKKYLIQLDYR